MSIKQEDTKTPAKTFSTLVKEVIYSNRDLWHLEDRIPLLGEVCFGFTYRGVSFPFLLPRNCCA